MKRPILQIPRVSAYCSTNQHAWDGGSFLLFVAAITLVALGIRGFFLWRGSPMVMGGDEGEYAALAENLLRTREFRATEFIQGLFQGGQPGDHTAYRSPVLPLLLAGHYAVFGLEQLYPRLTLILLSSLVCVGLAFLGRTLDYPGAGLIAAVFWAIWPPAVISPYGADRYYPETLGIFFLVAAWLCISIGVRRERIYPWMIAGGLGLGLAVMTRGYLILLLPIIGLYLFCLRSPVGRRGAVILLCCSSLVFGGWVVRNYFVVGKWALSTQTEAFYFGNNAWARGSFNGDFYTLGKQSPQLQALEKKYPNIWSMSEVERAEMWSREGEAAVLGNPSRFIWLLWRKTALFIGPFQFWEFSFYRRHYALIPVLILAVVAMWAELRKGRWQELAILLMPVLAVYLATLITYGLDRYRFVIEPFLLLMSAIGLLDLIKGQKIRAVDGSVSV